MINEKKRVPVQAISRAADILRCFVTVDELGLTELSKLVGLKKSTTAGLVTSLKIEGLLQQNERGKLQLGLELFRLGSRVNPSLIEIARPFLRRMLEQSGETVNLAVRDGHMITYLNKLESTHSVRICTTIGQKTPFYCTAIGKAIFAHLDEEIVRAAFNAAPPIKYTDYTIIDYNDLMNDFNKVRQCGYAIDQEEFEKGLICVAAPIFDRNSIPIAAISISGPSQRVHEQAMQRNIRIVLNTAAEIRL